MAQLPPATGFAERLEELLATEAGAQEAPKRRAALELYAKGLIPRDTFSAGTPVALQDVEDYDEGYQARQETGEPD